MNNEVTWEHTCWDRLACPSVTSMLKPSSASDSVPGVGLRGVTFIDFYTRLAPTSIEACLASPSCPTFSPRGSRRGAARPSPPPPHPPAYPSSSPPPCSL